MRRKLGLPIRPSDIPEQGEPTVDVMRARLGGRLEPTPTLSAFRIGSVVKVRVGDESPRGGVMIAVADGGALEVFLESGFVRRTLAENVSLWIGDPGPTLSRIAKSASAFAALAEGQRVQIDRVGGVRTGTLREKCRYGALVEDDSGQIHAVGFAKVWPASTAPESAPS